MAQSGTSTYLATLLLNFTYRGGVFVPATDLYIGLHRAAVSYTGGGDEVPTIGTAYARYHITGLSTFWTAPNAAREIKNVAELGYASPTADWGLLTHFGIYDALTVGNLWDFGKLANPILILAGAPPFTIPALGLILKHD